MRTFAELRDALRIWGIPGDLQAFERELADADLDDFTRVLRSPRPTGTGSSCGATRRR
ncbi:hypothetical protein ACFXA0_22625 [Streptomyces cyaneofuscatus]|uniref:hypothetical protein n=1 Tax=Streptomyces TaxID=1883 RepID=UPI001F42DE9D|nr:hypothetical protein [Streptomyces sp. SID2119]